MTTLVLKVIFALGVVLLLVALAAWAARRLGVRPGGSRSPLGPEVIASTHLAPKQSVHLVRVGDTAVLVGASRDGLSALGTFPLPAATRDADGLSRSPAPGGTGVAFLDYVEKALRGGQKTPGDVAVPARRGFRASANKLAP